MKRLMSPWIYITMIALLSTARAQSLGIPTAGFEPLSENTAQALSLAGTLIPAAAGLASGGTEGWSMILAGTTIGPSLGYFYGGHPGHGLAGIGIRLAGEGIMAGAFAISWNGGNGADEGAVWVVAMFCSGAGILAGDAIYDLAHVKTSVRNHNLAKHKASLSLGPTYFAYSKAPGLALNVTF